MMPILAGERTNDHHSRHLRELSVSGHRPLVVGCDRARHAAAVRREPRPALLVDRDGVLVENRDDYILAPSHVALLRDVCPALAAVQEMAVPIVIVSNQSAAGRGLITTSQTVEIHQHILGLLAMADVTPTCSMICPHRPEDHCHCRKPEPGMPMEAARVHGIDLARSCLVGDARSDITAARRAGVGHSFLVLTGRGAREERHLSVTERRSVTVTTNLATAIRAWMAKTGTRPRSAGWSGQ